MAHSPKPFFRTARNAWYVQLGTKQTKLVDGPKNTDTEKAAWTAFHALMASRNSANSAAPQPPQNAGVTLADLFEKYLEWCQKHREPRTYAGYLWHLQRFIDHLKSKNTPATGMAALDLRPFHVNEWLDAHGDWGQTYRRNAIASIKRAFVWGEEEGYLDRNPLKSLKKPMAKRQERFVSPDDWEKIRDSYKPGDPFREFLTFCWFTGCRPQEARHIEARHVHLDKAVIAIPPEEAKGRKQWRLIRLEGEALEIVRKRLPNAKAKLFVNRDGVAWTSFALNCRFHRLKDKLGERFSPYLFRHGFCQKMLVSGVDHLTVAALLGHADGTMVSKVYSHMDQADAHLREALRKGGQQIG